jgi:3'(2'), 5'-bisphosphate nucleotidase
MNPLLQTAITAALEAGKTIMEIYNSGDFGVNFKSDASPLTRADIAANTLIKKHLEESNIPILSEEGELIPFEIRRNLSHYWMVDPIDGTKEFIKRNGQFTVNIALITQGIASMGVIYVPATGVLYFGEESIGSFKVSVPSSVVSIEDLFLNALKLPFAIERPSFKVVTSGSHPSMEALQFIENLKATHNEVTVIFKGSSLKFCLVAEGSFDCYPRFSPTMQWDVAAGQAIAKYAGVEVYDLVTQSEMRYDREELVNNSFIVRRANS